ncbi:MAG TPA: ABC transporter substrate-binding protein [Solirubrobacteraceae bacterium]|jgi:peptide/nickel transport system substrate-binding protein|nr:ABC transporter substrate-binding protein [Solirubrobacteraceae bacterium]
MTEGADVFVSASERGGGSPWDGLTRREIIRKGAGVGLTVSSAGVLLAACGSSSSGPTATAKPKRGGTLTVGLPSGSSTDVIDPHKASLTPDFARTYTLFDPLVFLNGGNSLEYKLAESITADKPDVWTVRMRPGVKTHDGKTFGAADAIYTIQRILNPKTAATMSALLGKVVDPHGLTKLDALTFRMKLLTPCGFLPYLFADPNLQPLMVPVGFDPKKPVGTGPFKFESFTPGSSSVYTAFDEYWGGRPHIDKLVLTDLTDDTARTNALVGGQVDAISSIPFNNIATVKGNSSLQVLNTTAGAWYPILMNCATKPFSDVRARQAFRLLANRPQMIEQGYSGYGQLGNDLYGLYDPVYDHALPQRHQDTAQAKSLLKQAGLQDYAFTLTATNFGPGALAYSVAFGQQCNAAGVKVKVDQVPISVYVGPNDLKWPLANDAWAASPYLNMASIADGPKACFPDTHFGDTEPQFAKLYYEALKTLDPTLHKEITGEMQRIQYDRGSYIVWSFLNTDDGASTKTQGWKLDPSGRSFGSWRFQDVYFV